MTREWPRLLVQRMLLLQRLLMARETGNAGRCLLHLCRASKTAIIGVHSLGTPVGRRSYSESRSRCFLFCSNAAFPGMLVKMIT